VADGARSLPEVGARPDRATSAHLRRRFVYRQVCFLQRQLVRHGRLLPNLLTPCRYTQAFGVP
jgi:hypothetical protein